jgi:hypothetical protein
VIAIGKHLGLVRQIGAARIHQIDAGEPVLGGNLLGAQMLFDGQRIICATLDGRVIANDHAGSAFDAADARNDPGAVDVAVIHAEGSERR